MKDRERHSKNFAAENFDHRCRRQNKQDSGSTPKTFQARMYELDIIEIGTEKRVVHRRSLDARIWGGMTEEQQLKAEALVSGYMLHTGGLGVSGQNFERTERATARGVPANLRYERWTRKCRAAGIDITGTLSILVAGHSYATVDRMTRRRRHTTRAEMMRCLALFD